MRTSNANSVAPNATWKPGAYGKRIIKTEIRDGREWQLHSTKGWRNYRLVSGVNK